MARPSRVAVLVVTKSLIGMSLEDSPTTSVTTRCLLLPYGVRPISNASFASERRSCPAPGVEVVASQTATASRA